MNTQALQAVADDKVSWQQGERAAFLFERVIQINEWLKDYHVTICL
jgi:hypothetical protein